MRDDEPNRIEDLMPDARFPQWVAIIECSECGFNGTMYATDEPRETTVWDCEQCGYEDAVHHTRMVSNESSQIKR